MTSLVVGAATGGCATPFPLVRLAPATPDVIWVSGRPSAIKEAAGIRVAAAFDHQDGANLGIRVEVENATEQNLDVDPHAFTFATCRAPARETCGASRRVVDPEAVLAALDERQSREQANATNSQAFLGTLVILSAVGDVATVASGRADDRTGGGTADAAALMNGDAAARNTSLASLQAQRQVWSNEALRRNTVLPGRGTGGEVFVPADLGAQNVWLDVRAGGQLFSFLFRQTVTSLTPPAAPAPQGSSHR